MRHHTLPATNSLLHPTRYAFTVFTSYKNFNISIISEKNREAAKGLCPDVKPFLFPCPKRRWYEVQAMNWSNLFEKIFYKLFCCKYLINNI